MRYVAVSTIFLFAVVFSASVSAQNQFYAGIAGGYAMERFDDDETKLDNTFSGHVFLGYNVTDVIVLEGSIGYYFGWEPGEDDIAQIVESYGLSDEDSDVKLKLFSFMITGKYLFSPGNVWQPYIKAGAGWGRFTYKVEGKLNRVNASFEEDDSGLLISAGGGIQGTISENIMFIADLSYVIATGDIEEHNFIDMRIGVALGF